MKSQYGWAQQISEEPVFKRSFFVEAGRRGGLAGDRKAKSKGGKARAKKLSAKRRSEIASLAAKKRWAKKRPRRPVVFDDFLRD